MRIDLETEKCRLKDYVWRKPLNLDKFKAKWKKDKKKDKK